jgi:choloylglycine hydrolase
MGAFDNGATEGINERGLAAHMLYLAGTKFEPRDLKRPGIGFWLWVQYYLDNYRSVREALGDPNPPQIAAGSFGPYTDGVPVHLALADIHQDSAVIEFVDGQPVIHLGERYQVMTNEPSYDEQIANLLRYKEWGGTLTELPGGIQANERFVRAAYSLKYLPKTDDPERATASMLSIMNNVSVPFGWPYVGVTDTYPTWWRSVINLSDRVYAVQTTVTPSVFWVELDALASVAASKPRKLPIFDASLVGEVSDRFVEASQPF